MPPGHLLMVALEPPTHKLQQFKDAVYADGGLGTLAIDWPLQFVLASEVAFSLSSLALNGLLHHVIRQFNVYHDHLRVLTSHQTLAVLSLSALYFLRAIRVHYESAWMQKRVPALDEVLDVSSGCPQAPVPSAPLLLLLALSMAVCCKRYYATLQYTRYERASGATRALKRACALAWLPCMACTIFSSYCSLLFDTRRSWLACDAVDDVIPSMPRSTLRVENVLFVFFALFNLAYAAIFMMLATENRRNEIEYVKNNYDSFSSRYLIRQNKETCQLLQPIHVMLALTAAAFVIVDYALANDLLAARHAILRWLQELKYTLFPLFGIAYAGCFMRLSKLVRTKVRVSIEECARGSLLFVFDRL